MEETTMDANISSPTSSASSSGGVNASPASITTTTAGINSSASSQAQSLQQTPNVTVEYLNHEPEHEPGEIIDMPPTRSPSPHTPDRNVSPPPTLSALGVQEPDGSSNATSSAQKDTSGTHAEAGGSGRSNGSSSSVISNPIASDHCYGLPYQDHNYGTASSYPTNRNNSGNGNGSNGNNGNSNGGSYSTGTQRHPSGSHRLSISSGGTGSPAQGSRLSSGGATPISGSGVMIASRRLNFYPNGGTSNRPPTLPQYGPTSVSSSTESRVSPSIGSYAVDRTSFSDDDGSAVRSEVYGLMSPGGPAPVLSPAAGNGSSPTTTSSTVSAVPSSPGSGLTVLGQSGITVTTSGQVRGRLRSVGMRPPSQEPGHGYHGLPAIHPRLAPPNPTRTGVGLNMSSSLDFYRNTGRTLTTSNTIGSGFNSVMLAAGPPSLQKQQQHPFSHFPIKTPSTSQSPSIAAFPRQSLVNVMQNASLAAVNGGSQQPPPKRPGRPKGTRAVGQQLPRQQHQTMQVPASISPAGGQSGNPLKTSRGRKSLSRQQQPTQQPLSSMSGPPPGISATGVHKTPFSPSGLMGQPLMLANRPTTQQAGAATTSSPVDTVSTILEAVAAGLTTPPSLPPPLLSSLQHSLVSYQSTLNAHQRSAHPSAVPEAIGGPPMVGTSTIIPAHPMFANPVAVSTASVGFMGAAGIMNSQQQHQPPSLADTPQEKFTISPSTNTTPPQLGKEGFREQYNNRMSELCAQIGISDKDDDLKPKSKSTFRSSPYARNDQRLAASFREGKEKPRGRQKKLKVEADEPMDIGEGTSGIKIEPMEGPKMEKANNGKLSTEDGLETSSDEDNSSADEWEGKDYTTRCLCEMEHNDEFMIQCDRCEVWQHCECMGLDTKNIPDNYLCERCDPRSLKLTRAEAQRLQQAKVLQMKKRKAAAAARRRRRMANTNRVSMSSGSSAIAGGRGRPRKSIEASASNATLNRKRTISSGDANANKRSKLSNSPGLASEAFTEAIRNICTAKVAKAVRAFGDTVGAANLLSQLPSEPLCKFMYVAAGRQGLVATATVLPDLPIIEYRGKVCWSTDFEVPDGKGGRVPIVAPYLLYYQSGGADGSDVFSICVDARQTGTSARFVRRSCQPNSQVKHVVCNGALHLLLVSTELIECGAEITIPFDYDMSKCNFKLECACSNSPLLTPNPDCPVEQHNKSLPLPGMASMTNTNGSGLSQEEMIQLLPQKRRPGRPPGSGKSQRQQQANRTNVTTSATTAAARKKSKKARGFKVRIVGKKKQQPVFAGNNARGGKMKGATSKLKLRQQERVAKKFKPTATADLTKRRFSDDSREEPMVGQNGNDPVPGKSPTHTSAPGSTQRPGGAKVGRTKLIVSPNATSAAAPSDQHSPQQQLSREERKMQTLMEQISRMEQREQKKAEKKMAKMRNDGDSSTKPAKKSSAKTTTTPAGKKGKNVQAVGRRKSATMDRSVAAARRKRAESEATGLVDGAMRPRLWSENGETSSISSIDSDDDDIVPVPKGSGLQPQSTTRSGIETSSLLRATAALSALKQQRFATGASTSLASTALSQQPKATASDVAKKRWLRQAMSDETIKNTTVPPSSAGLAMHVDTKPIGDSLTPMQTSPSSTVAPPKKRIIQEFSNTSSVGLGDHGASGTTAIIHPSQGASSQEGPISTVEAAQLLAELHHQQVVVSQQSTDPTEGASVWKSTADQSQPQLPALKMIHPEEHPPSSVPPIITPNAISSTVPISSNILSMLATTLAAVDGANFTNTPYFTSPIAPMGVGIQSEVLPSYPVTTTGSALLYSAIEDDVPTVSAGLTTDGSHGPPEMPQQVQKKKVMSFDEYKKRKRDSVNEIPPTTPGAESGEGSPISNPGTTPTSTTVGMNLAQRQHSFIPQIKDGDVVTRNIRLSSVPDPETIGKSSATLDDLRKRIYNRTSFTRKPQTSADAPQQESGASTSQPPTIGQAADTDPQSGQTDAGRDPSTPPGDITTVQSTEPVDESPEATVHRLSLIDRLRVEFGVD